MNNIAIYLIIVAMALLALWAIYIIFTKPKEILFGFLTAIRPLPGHIWNVFNILFFPIWAPISYLDRKYSWGIYDRDLWR